MPPPLNSAMAEKILDGGGDLNVIDSDGNTPVWTAVFNARAKYGMVETLARLGAAKVADQKNKHGRSPSDFASQIGDKTILGLLGK